jgi:cysteine desulfurase
MDKRRVYLDHSATTPVRPEVVESMERYWTDSFGNPSSLHACGQWTRAAVEESRDRIAGLLGVEPKTIYFTSGGSEGDNFALKGIAFKNLDKKGHIITSQIEHKAVLESAEFLEKIGFDVTYLPVDKYGMIDPQSLRDAIRDNTLVISIMWANNEVGTIEPIAELAQIANEHDIPFHTDAVQMVGKLPIDIKGSNINMLTATAHKFYGPKGVGFQYIDNNTRRKLTPIIHGGSHERGFRAGTENIAGIVGMATALQLAYDNMELEREQLKRIGDYLEEGLKLHIEGIHFNGHPEKRLPGFVNVSIGKVEGEAMLLALDMQGIEASSGSACTSKSLEPSHVLKAMGIDIVLAHGSIRFTTGRSTTTDDIDYLLRVFPPIVDRLREMSVL